MPFAMLCQCRAFITPDTKLLFTLATEGAVRSPTELAQAVQQLAAMLSCLQQLLTHPTATAVPVPARAILGVVCRMLAFQECVSLQGVLAACVCEPSMRMHVIGARCGRCM